LVKKKNPKRKALRALIPSPNSNPGQPRRKKKFEEGGRTQW